MYALVLFVGVWKNIGRMLLFVVRTYVGGPLDIRSVNSTWMYVEMPDVRYFLGIPYG
jgi:hypothetical protein